MTKVVCVRFRTPPGKIYYFDPEEVLVTKGQHVIVDTSRGIEFGTAVSDIIEIEDEKITAPLRRVLRIAGERDEEQEASNRVKEQEALKLCREKISARNLDMKLVKAEYTFDNNKILFYFTAEGRVDFRDLVRDLASVFRTRIELRQIGVRDETRMLGGIGICGRVLCCHAHLDDFIPVSIKMAKEQNLSLNPTKISGSCGRLMCCLKHEEETYEELNRSLPRYGEIVTTLEGIKGEVVGLNVLRQLVRILIEDGEDKEIKEFHVDQLRFHRFNKPKKDKGFGKHEKGKKNSHHHRETREEEEDIYDDISDDEDMDYIEVSEAEDE